MSPSKLAKVDDSLVEQLCSIASVTRIVAANLLEACGNDLEMAVNMQMEGLVTETNESHEEDNVRAPIPQRQEVLVEGPDQLAYSFRGRTRVTRSVFDKFRNFEAETKRQEEILNENGESSSSSNASSSSRNYKSKVKTLEDLFRPPLDLMFKGNFLSARDFGVSSKRWLMVNVQNSSEFPCQVLNRDVWSNSAVQTIVQEHFIFWQVYHDSEDGQRYMTFYSVNDWPYIAVIDPRTGELLAHWHRIDAVSFCDIITEFLSNHPPFQDNHSLSTPPCASPPSKKVKSNSSLLDADESAQIEAAIKASLSSIATNSSSKNTQSNNEDDCSSEDLDTFESDDNEESKDILSKDSTSVVNSNQNSSNEVTVPVLDDGETKILPSENDNTDSTSEDTSQKWKLYLGKDTDPLCKLIIRMPDGSRDCLDIPATSKLMALVLYVSSKGYSNERFELVTNYPKRRLSYLDFESSLQSIGLNSQETVFIQKR